MFGSQCDWVALQHHFHSVRVILSVPYNKCHTIQTRRRIVASFSSSFAFFSSHFSLLTLKFSIRILACSYNRLPSGWHQLIGNATARNTYYNFGAQTPNIPISCSGFDGARATSKLVYFNVPTITVDYFRGTQNNSVEHFTHVLFGAIRWIYKLRVFFASCQIRCAIDTYNIISVLQSLQ